MIKHNKSIIAFLLFGVFIASLDPVFSQNNSKQFSDTYADIFGQVTCEGESIPFASIGIKGTTMGASTNQLGHYKLSNIPFGKYRVFVSVVGYKTKELVVVLSKGESVEVNFDIEKDVMNIDEVVVSANRSEQKRSEAPVIVNTLSHKLINSTQSITLGEGLNFSPGLRLENNCQNCGFTQVRMNGMEGAYSQILINSRPIFSGLAGVYGLELIPTNMIDKIEVIRGGGSALYGGNAIAGTINVIMKESSVNSYEVGSNYGVSGIGADGNQSNDFSVNFNSSVVSINNKSGVSLYGFSRKRGMYDANNDDFSEIAPLENLTFGAKAFHKFGLRDKLTFDFFGINEQRDGGNKQEYPLHERDIAESLTHSMKVAGLKYETYIREYDLLTFFGSGQFLDRDSYYGAEQSLSDYGYSNGKTFNIGSQYKTQFENSSLIIGVENTTDFLKDSKLGYLDLDSVIIDWGDTTVTHPRYDNTLIADQSSVTTGVFTQYDHSLGKLKTSLGVRLDNYHIEDFALQQEDSKTNTVLIPRLSVMYDLLSDLKLRATYSQGYRAPQIFDEDLHIETSRLRQIKHKNSPDLKQETSHSYMASIDFNKFIGTTQTGLLIEGFYTKLNDAFSNELGEPDENGKVIYTRVNSSGALVNGINIELRLKPQGNIELSSGFTTQLSEYKELQDWGDKVFLRTPSRYGFFTLDWGLKNGFSLSASGNYTGTMKVLYEGIEEKAVDVNGLKDTESFFDLGLKLNYTIKLNGTSLQFLTGMKNIFNAFQSDFDRGIDRDPAYVYGPLTPRTVFIGIKFGNLLN